MNGFTTALVPLSDDTVAALEAAERRDGLNHAQTINAAVAAWALIQAHQAAGGQIYLRFSDGQLERVRFEAGGAS